MPAAIKRSQTCLVSAAVLCEHYADTLGWLPRQCPVSAAVLCEHYNAKRYRVQDTLQRICCSLVRALLAQRAVRMQDHWGGICCSLVRALQLNHVVCFDADLVSAAVLCEHYDTQDLQT